MATTYYEALQKLYVAYFNRPADPAGLAYWEGVVEGTKGDTTAVSAAFAASNEYKDEYKGLDNGAILDKVYQNLFGHPADAGGKAYWKALLDTNKVTIDQVVTQVAGGALTTDKTAYTNKVAAAVAFTAALDTPAEVKGYAGAEALKLAKEFIAGVTDDASLADAISPANLAASVSGVVAVGPFSLADGLASLTAANDHKAAFLKGSLDVDVIAEEVEAIAADPDKPTDTEIETAIGNAVTTSAGDIDGIITGYSTHTATVRAAELALAQAQTKEALQTATKAQATSQAAVNKAEGLSAAITAAKSAADLVKSTTEAEAQANVDLTAAVGTYGVKNPDLTDDGNTPPEAFTTGGKTVIELKSGVYKVAAGIDATKYVGLTAVVTALNKEQDTNKAKADAAAAKTLADNTVHLLDFSSDASADLHKDVADAMVFGKAALGDVVTATEIANEKEAFASMLDDLDDLAAANGGTDYTTVIGDLKTAVGAAADMAAVKALTLAAKNAGYITSADKTAIDGSANMAAAATAVDSHNWADRSADFNTAVSALETAEYGGGSTDGLSADLTTKTANTKAANDAIKALADAVAGFSDVEHLNDQLTAENAAIEAAVKAFEDHDFAAPVVVGGTKIGTGADDVFLAGKADGIIKSFGVLGDDVLYIGSQFKLNTGDYTKGAGSDSVLEAFIVKDGSDTKIVLEKSVFGSNAATPEIVTITLTGVDSTHVKLADGFVTVA